MYKASRTIRRPAAVSAALVVAGALVAVPAGTSIAASTASVSSGSSSPDGAARVSSGTIRSVGTSNPRAIEPPPAGSGEPRLPLLPELNPYAGSYRAGNAPSAPSATKPSGPVALAGKIAHNFSGLDALDNRRAAGFNLEPPDEGLGASSDFVANFVNVAGAFYRTNGHRVGKPFYLNTFFHEPDLANTSDPRVFYDAASHRWFASILVYNFTRSGRKLAGSHIDLAVSRHADPTRRWKVYTIPASNRRHAGCPCLADYPIMGIDHYNVYISTNEFTRDFSGFNGTQLYAVSKSQLVAGRNRANIAKMENLAAAGAPAYHVQPANTYGRSAAEWMMSSLDPNSTNDHRLAVWALTHRQSVTRGHGHPSLSVRVIGSESYSFPPLAHTPPGYCSSCGEATSGVVDTDFDAMQEVQYINGQLVGALNTGVTVAGDTTERSGLAWFVVHPRLTRNTVGASTRVARQGYLAAQGLYLLYPHINMTPNGAMAMTFGFGGLDTYLSAGYSVALPGGRFHDVKRAAAGTGPDNGFTGTELYGGPNPVGRWGDYSNGEIIPGTNRVWLATQYIPNSGTGYANWGNRIFELKLGG